MYAYVNIYVYQCIGGNARDLQLRHVQHTLKMSAELMLRLLSASVAACRHAASIIREIAQGGNLRIKDKVCVIAWGRAG